MFKNPFSFDGRIRRTEYGLSFIIFVVARVIIGLIVASIFMDSPKASSMVAINFLFNIPIMWFFFAQGAKRCHDVQKNGWWQLIPFFPLYLIFAEGNKGSNEYGNDPKQHLNTENF